MLALIELGSPYSYYWAYNHLNSASMVLISFLKQMDWESGDRDLSVCVITLSFT